MTGIVRKPILLKIISSAAGIDTAMKANTRRTTGIGIYRNFPWSGEPESLKKIGNLRKGNGMMSLEIVKADMIRTARLINPAITDSGGAENEKKQIGKKSEKNAG